MNFKILSVAIVVAATLSALASMPITATPAYAGGNVHVNNVNNHATDSDADFDCVGNDITGSCNTTINNPPKEEECKPNPHSNPPKVCP
jgi:uncharacterized membrane protein